jgi:hypothetical protein
MGEIMKKPSINLRWGFIIFGIIVVGILAYISLLGENQQINRIITSYFDKIKEGDYLEACEGFASNFQEGKFTTDEQRMNFNFLFELSLLRHYNLIESHDYKVELERSNFWAPYISDDEVRVSILLKKKGTRRFFLLPASEEGGNFIHNLIVMKREKRTWKIKEFTIADSALAGDYNDSRQNFDLNKYVQVTSDGFRFNSADINFKTLTPLDKRLLSFSLYKMQKLLNIPRKKSRGLPLAP